jgi:hypothetical protein
MANFTAVTAATNGSVVSINFHLFKGAPVESAGGTIASPRHRGQEVY